MKRISLIIIMVVSTWILFNFRGIISYASEDYEIVTLKQYGGIANKSDYDNSNALKKAILDINGKKKILLIEPGIYEFKESIVISEAIEEIHIWGIAAGGFSKKGAYFNWSGKGYFLQFENNVKNLFISQLILRCNGNSAIEIKDRIENSCFENLYIFNSIKGVYIGSFENVVLKNVSILVETELCEYAISIGKNGDCSNNILFEHCSFDGADIANCNAVKIYAGTDIYIKDSDICNWGKGGSIYFTSSQYYYNEIVLDGLNIARCDKGIICENVLIEKGIILYNVSFIFRGMCEDEVAISLSGNKESVKLLMSGCHTRKIGNINPKKIIEDCFGTLKKDSNICLLQDLARGEMGVSNQADNLDKAECSNKIRAKEDLLYSEAIKEYIDVNLFFQNNYEYIKTMKIEGIYFFDDFGGNCNQKDNTKSFISAMDKMKDKGGLLIFDNKTYSFLTPIVIDYAFRGINLLGREDTVFDWNGDGYLMTLKGNFSGSNIKAVDILCNGNNSAINIDGVMYKSYISDIRIDAAVKGIEIGGYAYGFVERVYLNNLNNNIEFGICLGSDYEKTREYLYIEDIVIAGENESEANAIWVKSGTHIYIYNCKVRNWKEAVALKVEREASAPMLSMVYLSKIYLNNCKFGVKFQADNFIGVSIIDNLRVWIDNYENGLIFEHTGDKYTKKSINDCKVYDLKYS